MKNLILILISLFILGVDGARAQMCAPVPTGLVSAFSGDGNTLDPRSRSNGTLQNGASYAGGEVGQAFSLDGVDDQVTFPHVELQNTGSGLTLEAWIYPVTTPHGATIVQQRSPGNIGGYVLELVNTPFGPANAIGFYVYDIGSGSVQVQSPANAITPNTWQHVAGTYDGSFLRIYVNGVEVASQSAPGYSAKPSTEPIVVGRNVVNTSLAFNGKIDEVAIYNRGLAPTEIAAIYNAGTSGKCGPIATNAPDNQVLWLAGDGDATDSSGNGNNGTIQTGAAFAVGNVGQGFQFSGTAQNQVLIPDSPSLRPTTAITFDAWINPSSAGTGFQTVLFKGSTGSSAGQPYSLFLSGATHNIVARIGNDSTFEAFSSLAGIPANTYSHVAVTYDGATVRIYINGILDSSAACGIGALAQSNTQELRIGSLGGSFAYTGGVDEVDIFNRALSASEIQSIVNAGLAGKYKVQATVPADMVAWYPGDGNASDIQAANTAAPMGGATYAIGKVGQAFNLNGTSAFVQAPSSVANDPTGAANGASMEAWFYLNQLPSAAGHPMFIMSKSGTVGTDLFEIRIDPDDRVKFLFRGGGADANIIVQTGTWYHVVGTFNPVTPIISIYINGGLRALGASGGARTVSGVPLDIGHSSAQGGNRFFNGLIDEPAIYNRALTPEEIRDQFYAGSLGKYKGSSNPAVTNKAKAGEVEVTLAGVTRAGAIQATPISLASMPPLPVGAVGTGLNFDLSTTALFTGQASYCFNLPALTQAQFMDIGILHLEGGAWVDRATARNAANRTICGSSPTLSPFAIAHVLNPTAANASISGRILSANGRGIAGAVVTIAGSSGSRMRTISSSLGYYRFDELATGQSYVVGVSAKRYTFTPATLLISLVDEATNVDFVGENQ